MAPYPQNVLRNSEEVPTAPKPRGTAPREHGGTLRFLKDQMDSKIGAIFHTVDTRKLEYDRPMIPKQKTSGLSLEVFGHVFTCVCGLGREMSGPSSTRAARQPRFRSLSQDNDLKRNREKSSQAKGTHAAWQRDRHV